MSRADGKVAGKRGKKDAVRPAGLAELVDYLVSPFPPLPPTVPVPVVKDWGMDGNDEYGNCVTCGGAHDVAACDTYVPATGAVAVPTSNQVVAQYKALTGCQEPGDANDTGLVIADFLADWKAGGMFGGPAIAAYAPVSLTTPGDIRQTIANYGACLLGIQCPESAEDQFNDDEDWSYVEGSPIVGGHCILAVGFDGIWIQCVTWGAVVNVGPRFLEHYMDEAWAVIPAAFVAAGKGPELNLAQLEADLASLKAK